MAGREELVDAIAGFALFADLTAPQLEGIVHTFDEAVFGEGERILRQGISGSGFHVILDGEAAIVVDGTERARLGPRRLLRGGLDPPRRDAHRGRRRARARCAAWSSPAPAVGGVPGRPPAGHVPDAPGAGPPASSREPMAELTRPFPPGSYPVIVIGSGPGGLQVSYSLRALGVPHAVLSADPAPGGMFRRWPFFQRLLSWTKPYAPVERGSRAYERYDWNSLLGEETGHPRDRPDADGRHAPTSRHARRWRRTSRRSRSGPRSRSATTARGRATRLLEGRRRRRPVRGRDHRRALHLRHA